MFIYDKAKFIFIYDKGTFMFIYDKVHQRAPQLTFYSVLAIVLLEKSGGSGISAYMPNALQNQCVWRDAWQIHNGNAGSEK